MKILFIGYSNLFKKRILPILNDLPEITEIHIAKYKEQKWDKDYMDIWKINRLYDNYEEGFINSDANICYISSVNSNHFKSAKESIDRGFHTIIDKPATTTISELRILLALAKKKNILLAESVVYTYHPNMAEIKNIFDNRKSSITNIHAIFSFPPLDSNNFRYKKELGGGAINDTGPYAASIGRYFFNQLPQKVYCSKILNSNNLDIGYTLLIEYPNNKTLTGHFGFTTEYTNQASFLGDNLFVTINRIFTPPEDLLIPIEIKSDDKIYIRYTYKENAFYVFFKEILSAIKNKNYDRFRNDMYKDGQILDMIRKPFN